MKTIHKVIKTVYLILGFMVACIAQPKIQFEFTEYDYGKIKEEEGPKKAVFTFKNVGTEPLQITAVRASCGCTASNYTREPVAPGQKGFVEAIYNPAYRPGPFQKSVSVTSNDPDRGTIVLVIKGDVIPKPPTKADNYPSKMGQIRFKTNHLAFQNILSIEKKIDSIGIYNEGQSQVVFKGTKELPHFITVTVKPTTLEPEHEGVIIITYDASKKNDLGYVFDKFIIETNDNEMPDKILYVSANISYDFSGLTDKQKARAPRIIFEKETYQFAEVKMGDPIDFEFSFRNDGKDPLQILKIKPSCACVLLNTQNLTLKSGQKGIIKGKFDTNNRSGNQYHNITVFTNDPNRPVISLAIQGEVIKD